MMRTICRIPKMMTPTRKTVPEGFSVYLLADKRQAARTLHRSYVPVSSARKSYDFENAVSPPPPATQEALSP
jgi:hypothetical protein